MSTPSIPGTTPSTPVHDAPNLTNPGGLEQQKLMVQCLNALVAFARSNAVGTATPSQD